jgi:hypothetical protein
LHNSTSGRVDFIEKQGICLSINERGDTITNTKGYDVSAMKSDNKERKDRLEPEDIPIMFYVINE